MMNRSSTATPRKDPPLLGSILLRLALPRLLARVAIILATIALVVYLAQHILLSGKAWLEFGIRVSGLSDILGKAVIDFVMQYQKYFWWFVIFVLVLIAVNFLLGYLRQSLKRGRAALVPLGDVRKLCARLSPQGLDVLNWAWKDQSHPITVGILQTTLTQIGSGRIRKLALARAQQAELTAALQNNPLDEPATTPLEPTEPPSRAPGQRGEPTMVARGPKRP